MAVAVKLAVVIPVPVATTIARAFALNDLRIIRAARLW